MWKALDKAKAVWDRVSFVWMVIGWLGFAGLFTGIAASIGGSILAMATGVPIPIVIMAGYCTLVGAVYLGMAPLAYKTLAAASGRGYRNSRDEPPAPDYAAWLHIETLSLLNAARLWCDYDPHYAPKGKAASKVETALLMLKDAVKRGELALAPGHEAIDRRYPDSNNSTTRSALRDLAKRRSLAPRFLLDKPV